LSPIARIEIDRNQCAGHARCLTISPDMFDLDDEGRAIWLRQPETADEVEGARRAAHGCPEQAIRVDEGS
jgi:ferredoxin